MSDPMYLVWSSDRSNWGAAETAMGGYAMAVWIWVWMTLSMNPRIMRVEPIGRELYYRLLRDVTFRPPPPSEE